ncbi:MAG: helix-turn-helix domain-containing protein [Oscillibacter sp.]|nr:helix-turn-helix domain-containing protein [Oscillibacter sp.]
MEKRLLTVAEAAAILRISKSKVYHLIHEDRLPHVSIDNRHLIPSASLFAWIDNSICGG